MPPVQIDIGAAGAGLAAAGKRTGGGRYQSGIVAMTAPLQIRNFVLPGALLLAALALAGCETTSPGPLGAAQSSPPPMTHVQAAEACWMETEKSEARLNLDKRADLVDKCIAEKTGEKTADAAADAKPVTKPPTKPKAKPEAKLEAKPQDKSKDKPKAKSDADAKSDAKSDAKPDSKPDAKP
jgi:hypothetical protein